MPDLDSLSATRQDLIQKVLDGTLSLCAEAPLAGGIANGRPAPLSSWQLYVWKQAQLAAQVAPGVHLFNETITIHRSGPLDVKALGKSFNEILRRHEAWRTTFRLVNAEPLQFVNPYTPISLQVVDLSKLPEVEMERRALDLATMDARRPFYLETGPLVRIKLVKLSGNKWRLFLTAHQIVLDGVSVYHVFLPELLALYKAFSRNQSYSLPALAVQYPDYAIWQRNLLQSDVVAREMAYWGKQLTKLPECSLPLDRRRSAHRTFRGSILPVALPGQLSEKARAYSRQEGVTLFITLLSAFYVLLQRYSAQHDLVVGTMAPTRKRSEVYGLLGYFLNPLVLRLNMAGNPNFGEVVHRVRHVFLEALSNGDVPFDSIVERFQPEGNLNRHPFYQIQISLEPPLPVLDEGWNLTPMDFESGGAKLDLYLVFDDRPSGLIGRLQYNPDTFDVACMQRLVQHYSSLLNQVLTDPCRQLSALPNFAFQD